MGRMDDASVSMAIQGFERRLKRVKLLAKQATKVEGLMTSVERESAQPGSALNLLLTH